MVSYAKDSVRRYIENTPIASGKRQVGCVIFVRNEKNDEERITVKLQKIDPDGTETISGTVTAGGRTVLLVRAK